MTHCVALLLCLTASCAAFNKDVAESPACQGFTLATVEADVPLVVQLAAQLTADQFSAAMDAFVAAKGLAQATCVFQLVEAALGHPVSPVDAGPPDAGAPAPPTALERALILNPSTQRSALEKLQAYRAAHTL